MSLPIPSGRPKSEGGRGEFEDGVDFIGVHPGVIKAVQIRIKIIDINFFKTASSLLYDFMR